MRLTILLIVATMYATIGGILYTAVKDLPVTTTGDATLIQFFIIIGVLFASGIICVFAAFK